MKRDAGREVCIFYLGENIFPFLRSKGSGLLFPAQGEPPWGLVGWEKIILASLRYFFPAKPCAGNCQSATRPL